MLQMQGQLSANHPTVQTFLIIGVLAELSKNSRRELPRHQVGHRNTAEFEQKTSTTNDGESSTPYAPVRPIVSYSV
jgi:hypothetical protein